jgi:hypothetical protein
MRASLTPVRLPGLLLKGRCSENAAPRDLLVVDKRRSRRFLCRMVADFHGKGPSRSLTTSNVSRHGIFVITPDPPPERHVVQLTLHTSMGKVRATAWVSRSVRDHPQPHRRGAGLQFFSLGTEDKARWDDFFYQLSSDLASRLELSEPATAKASFVVKLGSVEKLLEFDRTCLVQGAMFLVTPVLKPVGTSVALHMVHPATDEEFVLTGVVARLHTRRPKGVEIHLPDLTRKLRSRFRDFISTGAPLLDEHSVLRTEPGRPAPAEAVHSDSDSAEAVPEDDAFDIEVIDADLSPDVVFEWDEANEELTVDLDIDDEILIDLDEVTGIRRAPEPPASGELTMATTPPASAEELVERLAASVEVAVTCSGCGVDARLTLGPAAGLLGLVANDVPLWDPEAGQPVARPRLCAPSEQHERIEALAGPDGDLAAVSVPLEVMLEAVRLSEAPTGEEGRRLLGAKAVRALEQQAKKLARGEEVTLQGAACPGCEDGQWTVRRLDG